MEYKAPVGWGGPPRHLHLSQDEVFFVLEGEITVYLGEQQVHGSTGSYLQVPRGTVHSFSNPGNASARYLIFAFPAGLEGYFEELPGIVAQHGYPPPAEVMVELGKKYDMEAVGPPPRP